MKIRLLTDLHMEGWKFKYEYKGEDAVALLGDIHTLNRHEEIIDQITDVPILFVAGNHEYYGQDFDETNEYFKMLECMYDNFYFLNNRTIELQGKKIFGGTMFTGFNLFGPAEAWFAKHAAKGCVADFRAIKRKHKGQHYEDRPWNTADHEEEFEKFCIALREACEGNRIDAILTHFMPHKGCVHPRFDGQLLNAYFVEDMTKYMGLAPVWMCGHGHNSFDFEVNGTRIVANPRGYAKENKDNFNPDMIIEI